MRKRLIKLLSTLCVTMMAGGLLVGCGGNSSSTSSDSKSTSSSEKVTLTFGSHQSGLPTSGVVQELAKQFESETGVKIDFQISPDAQWRDLLKVKLDSGEAPDIFCADADPLNLVTRVNPEKYVQDVSSEEWVKRLDPNVLPSISYNSKVYGITFPGKKMYFYVYNKEIFDKLGLKVPTNYAEFKAVCQKIKDSGVIPVYEGTQNGWHQVLPLFETGAMYQQKHPDLYSKLNKNEVDLDSVPELQTIIKELKEFADLGFYGDNYLSNSVENAKEAMAKGKAAMFIAESAWRNEVKADFPDFDTNKLGIFVMPWGDNQAIGVNPASNAYFINKNGKHVEEAKKFFDFLAKPENLQKRLDGQPGLSELCWPEVKSKYSKEDQAYIDSMQKGMVMQAGVKYIDSQWMDVGKDLEAMYTGSSTPEQVLQTIMNRRKEQAQLQKDPDWNK
ncbi:ABC transporter substrate-binding protein [Clostridium chromiireducens]|uniref:Carbohydrate ABC transporter substrate-binding protein n=1 Tax=Clostridium chromiireducens TaxID=225345 RepID=A0A1V4IT18_9CLOT|nr:ABC transporter substrate-binding protein [Clostridium chromiireducens]OPJ63168.1 multiple sugar-binding protein precursor [Clostridium chromiireducens]RII34645.1 carbohydrate ABC transporter substrate-binding protein [Clostridium chromiireducens]